MPISLRQLQIFEQVVQQGSVTRAAAELGLTQSAVSMAIAELERFAEAPLFIRHGKKLRVNDRGRELSPLITDLLEQQQRIEVFLRESLHQPVGTLHVGASSTIGNYLLPTIVGQFTARHPRTRILLHVGNALQIENGIDQGEYDLGLIEGYLHIDRVAIQPWRKDDLVVITGPEHPWASLRQATATMLESGAWIMREPGSGTREVFENAMKKEQLSWTIAMELGHTEAIKKAVESGNGCACLSRMAVQRELDHGWLVEIRTPLDLERELIILTQKNNRKTLLLKTFLKNLSEESAC